jgi:DNA-binding GntR family transcriptional regulator
VPHRLYGPKGIMFSITYSSVAAIDITDEELGTILIRARASNARLNITGALLYRLGRFIQILEGPEAVVREQFSRISADPRHTVDLTTEETTRSRRFGRWSMGFESATDSVDPIVARRNTLYESLPSASSMPEHPDQAHPTFDWLYEYWLAPEQGLGGRDNDNAPTYDVDGHGPTQSAIDPESQKHFVGSSDVVAFIFDKIMAEVHAGSLLPGDRVNDAKLAERLGVSRTPVREALQKLRDMGVIEVAANRFTRISVIDAEQTTQLLTVFIALYSAVLDEVIPHVPASVIDGLREDRANFLLQVDAGNTVHIASAGVDFYMRLVAESQNVALKKGIYSTIHVIQIGNVHLEKLVGLDVVTLSLSELIAAAETADTSRAKRALLSLTGAAVNTPPS